MAVKQHCDICDGVIPGSVSYRTVHFGRGNNPNISIGKDPMVICKTCWKKMLEGVGVSMSESEEQLERVSEKTVLKHEERVDDLVNDIADFIIKGTDKSCESCLYGNNSLSQTPCCNCTGKNKWEGKNGNTGT